MDAKIDSYVTKNNSNKVSDAIREQLAKHNYDNCQQKQINFKALKKN